MMTWLAPRCTDIDRWAVAVLPVSWLSPRSSKSHSGLRTPETLSPFVKPSSKLKKKKIQECWGPPQTRFVLFTLFFFSSFHGVRTLSSTRPSLCRFVGTKRSFFPQLRGNWLSGRKGSAPLLYPPPTRTHNSLCTGKSQILPFPLPTSMVSLRTMERGGFCWKNHRNPFFIFYSSRPHGCDSILVDSGCLLGFGVLQWSRAGFVSWESQKLVIWCTVCLGARVLWFHGN